MHIQKRNAEHIGEGLHLMIPQFGIDFAYIFASVVGQRALQTGWLYQYFASLKRVGLAVLERIYLYITQAESFANSSQYF